MPCNSGVPPAAGARAIVDTLIFLERYTEKRPNYPGYHTPIIRIDTIICIDSTISLYDINCIDVTCTTVSIHHANYPGYQMINPSK